MRIPMAKKAAAALQRMYCDRARVVRTETGENGVMVKKTVFDGIGCHLSAKTGLGRAKGTSFEQTAAHAGAKRGYVVFFPAGCGIKAGDLITVEHCGAEFEGRAGEPFFGELAVRVLLDKDIIL